MSIDIDELLRIPPHHPLELKRVQLNAVVAATLTDMRALVTATDATIQSAAKFPAVIGDRLLLTQLLTNLVSNALIYSHPRRRPKVRIDCTASREGVQLHVHDNGMGIAANDLEDIFMPRKRRDARGRSSHMAVGLAIAKRAAELMGGSIAVQSIAGRGSTFSVKLSRPR